MKSNVENKTGKALKELMHSKKVEMAKFNREYQLKKDHRLNMMIRKMDANASRVKEHSQKNPKEIILVPKVQIHKALG